jgi:transposase
METSTHSGISSTFDSSPNLLAELAQFNPDPALVSFLRATLQQAQQDASNLRLANIRNQALILELAYYKRLRFATKSEAFTVEQGLLFDESIVADISAIEVEVELGNPALDPATAAPASNPAAKKRNRAGRQPLPEHLPRIEHRYEPDSCTCGQCGINLTLIGEDVSEQLDVEPLRFFVHRHIRPQYACRACETVTAAPIPAAVIEGSLASPGLLAWVVANKFLDHLPLYRIEQISSRYGVPIARSTLAEWVGQIGVALQPLSDRLAAKLKARQVLHADETPVQQLDPGKGKTKRAYLWAYRSNDLDDGGGGGIDAGADAAHQHQYTPPIIVFDYQSGRGGSHARAFLEGWSGHLMVDDYPGYKALFRSGITELACMAHARRKFFDLYKANQSKVAAEALKRIAGLYDLERECTEAGLSVEDRGRQRQARAKPVLDDLYAWLCTTRKTVADGSGLARAIDYSLRRWPALMRYADGGNLPIDNNPVENSIRPIAIGKKNWLFAGSERSGKRAAAIQSLLGTAKLNGIEPNAWLKEALEKLPTWPNSRIDELLPLRTA